MIEQDLKHYENKYVEDLKKQEEQEETLKKEIELLAKQYKIYFLENTYIIEEISVNELYEIMMKDFVFNEYSDVEDWVIVWLDNQESVLLEERRC